MRNRGLLPEVVERLSNRPVPRIRVAPVDDPGLRRPGRFDDWRARSRNEVKIFRPERRRTEEAVRKFRKSQPGSGADVARDSNSDTPAPRTTRPPVKPAPPGMYPGGKPAIAVARPPRFERGPVEAKPPESKPSESKPSEAKREVDKREVDKAPPTPTPVATPPASTGKPAEPVIINPSTSPSGTSTVDGPVTGPNGKPPRIWRNPDQGAAASAAGAKPNDPKPNGQGASRATPSPDTAGAGNPPPPTGKRRWDGSGPSGAPSTAEPTGEPAAVDN